MPGVTQEHEWWLLFNLGHAVLPNPGGTAVQTASSETVFTVGHLVASWTPLPIPLQ